MNDLKKSTSLPEKVIRRHCEILTSLLPDVVRLVIEEGHAADTVLNNHLRTHRELGSRDRRFLSQAIFSYFRWRGWTTEKLGLDLVEACLVGTALDSTELADSFRYLETQCALPFKIEPMGNLSIQEKRAALNDHFKQTPDFQSLELVDLVIPGFESIVDPAAVERLIVEFQSRPPLWMRSRTDSAQLVQALSDRKVPCTIHDRVSTALSVESGISLSHLLSQHTGQFVVQDISSQCVGLVCAPEKGEEWWDCCAGSGGKSMHLMDLMQQEGKVLATDIRTAALKELKKRTRRHGIRHIRTNPFNVAIDEPFRKTFDGVLVDAPCSGWGTWARNPDARWRSSIKEATRCANRQLKILNNTVWCTKPGGTLVYAACTFTRSETEEVVMNFLDQHPRFKLDPFTNPLTGETTNGTLQIWPWDGPGNAMFIARFKRNEE